MATKITLTTVENKIPNVSRLAAKAELTAIENKIPDVSKFATKTVLTNLSNKVPDISTLIKKVTMTQKFQKLKTNMLVIFLSQSKLAQANVIKKLLRLKIIYKNCKYLSQAILEVKVILEKMVHKII